MPQESRLRLVASKLVRGLGRHHLGVLAFAAALVLVALAMLVSVGPMPAFHQRFSEGLRLGWTRLAIEQLRFHLDEQAEGHDAARDVAIQDTARQLVARLDAAGAAAGEWSVPLSTQRFLDAAHRAARLGPASTSVDYQAASDLGKAALADLEQRLQQESHVSQAQDGSKHEAIHRAQYLLTGGVLLFFVSLLTGRLEKRSSEVQAADSRYRSVFEGHPLPILVHDADSGRVVDANAAAARQYGYDLESLRGMPLAGLRPSPEDGVSSSFPEVDTSEFVGLWTHRKRDGTLFMAEVSSSKVEDETGNLRLTVVKDVTERERTLHRLSAEEAKFRSLAECLNEGILVTDLQGRVTYANPQLEQITGRPPEALLGRPVQEELEETRGTIERRILDRRRGISESYLQDIEKPDGTRVWLEVHSSPLTSVEGQIVGVVAALHDVTQRVEAARSLRDRESRLRAVLQQVPALVWTTDLDLRFTSLEGGLLDQDELKPESVGQLMDQDPSTAIALEAHRRALDGHVETYELEFAFHWFRCRVEPYLDGDGKIMGTVGAALDVTEAKRSELEREQLSRQLHHAHKMEAIGRLAGGIAHDFNNLLTIIDGNAEMHCIALEGEPPIEMVEIRQAAHSAAALTQQLLAFSRQQHIQPRVVEVDASVRQTCRLLRRVIGEDIEMVVSEGCGDARIEVDTAQLHQVLLNLAINARDAMPNGGRLEIRTDRHVVRQPIPVDGGTSGRELEPGEYVRIEVRDSGTGMDEATLQRIFEPFFTTKKPDVGTGLGLSTVHGIVRQSGGYVTVASGPGEGTTFTILLPRSQRKDSPWMLPVRPAVRTQGSARLLLVEDEAGLRRMLSRGLRKRGYTVLEAANGDSALELVAQGGEPVDLVVTDVLMPDMRGPELARRLEEAGVRAKLLYMSGYTDDALGAEVAAHEYLQKPFTIETLARRLEEMLQAPAASPAPAGTPT